MNNTLYYINTIIRLYSIVNSFYILLKKKEYIYGI